MSEELIRTPLQESAEADFGWNCDLVLAECNDVAGVVTSIAAVPCRRTIVYSKCSDCSAIVGSEDVAREANNGNSTVSCVQLANHGREQHTFLSHAATRYNDLSDRIYFVPLPLHRHDRLSILETLVRTPVDVSFVCDFYSVSNAASRLPSHYYSTPVNASDSLQGPNRIPSPPPPPGDNRYGRISESWPDLAASTTESRATTTSERAHATAGTTAGTVSTLSARERSETDMILLSLSRTMGHHRRLQDMDAMNETNRYYNYAYRFGHPNACGSSAHPDEGPCLDFWVSTYDGSHGPVVLDPPADVRPLWAWNEAHTGVGPTALSSVPICYFGTARTTRENLRSRPQALYEQLREQLSGGGQPEAGHYVERLMAATYGPPVHEWSEGSRSVDRSEGWQLAPHELRNSFIYGVSIGGALMLSCVLLLGWLALRFHGQRAAQSANENAPLTDEADSNKESLVQK